MMGEYWAGVGIGLALASILVFGTWLVALLPSYLLVPLDSPLWNWPICTMCGALSGAMIMYMVGCFFLWGIVQPQDYIGPCSIAAAAGGITCLFASLTRGYFQFSAGPR
jgi:hypothetical protein